MKPAEVFKKYESHGKPKDSLEREVGKNLKKLGFETDFVSQAPLDIFAKEQSDEVKSHITEVLAEIPDIKSVDLLTNAFEDEGYELTRAAAAEALHKIAKKLGYNLLDVIQKDHTGHNCLMRKSDGDCIFLERHRKKCSCKIYNYRPKVCRKYPGYKNDVLCKKANPCVKEYLMRI